MNINLAEFLKEYCNEIPESIRCGEIFKLTYSEKLDSMTFFAFFKNLIPSSDIFAFEKAVEKAVKVDRIRLACRYPSEIFGKKCYNQLIELLKRDINVNGFLDDADVKFSEDTISINLAHGGRDMLEQYHFCRSFSRLIYNQFGVEMKIELNGGETSSVEYNEMIEKAESEMPDYNSQFVQNEPEYQPPIQSQPIDITSLDTEFDKESAEIVIGKAIRNEPVPISEAVQRLGEKLVVVGDIFASELKELKTEKTVFTFDITDYSGSLKIKIFVKNEEVKNTKISSLKKGETILVSGKIDFDTFAHDIIIFPDSIIKVKRIPKMDNYPEKRVELHCHTNMSAMDAVTDPVTLINRAAMWGHQAMAITDHGAVQAFPDCMYNMPKNFKVIYGCEAYVVNDLDRPLILKNPDSRSINDEIIIFDVETTGLSFSGDRLTEIGAVKLRNLQVIDTFNTKVNPEKDIPENITELTGISNEDVKDAPKEKDAILKFMKFCGENPVLAAHNANFDTTFINEACKRNGIEFKYNWIDTLILCQIMLPEIARFEP